MVFALWLLLLLASATGAEQQGLFGKGSTFEVGNGTFLLNGEPFRYISGSIHYFRIPPDQWNDRLHRIRAAGFNAIQTYIPWNFHESWPGLFNWRGDRDLARFLQIAQQNELYVLLRVGPYSCGEWENGGLPWWHIKNKTIKMRTADPLFTGPTERFLRSVANVARPHLLKNGGNIIMVQLENEYGSLGVCDKDYKTFLNKLGRKLFGNDIVFYTTDGPSAAWLSCGTIDKDVLPTVDFGVSTPANIDTYFARQRTFWKNGLAPLVNSEFYPGWFVMWGQQENNVPDQKSIMDTVKYMYSVNASFNFYMMHGGTNFGFWNGAEVDAPVITSYDYSSPITEAGDITPNYLAIREWINTLPDWKHKPLPVPTNNSKKAYGRVLVKKVGDLANLTQYLKAPNTCITSKYPLSFEDMNFGYGFVLYETTLKVKGEVLEIKNYKDHAFVLLNGKYMGSMFSHFKRVEDNKLNLSGAEAGMKLSLLVENRGRQTFLTINDFKGILSNVTLDGQLIDEWEQCGIHMEEGLFEKLNDLKSSTSAEIRGPSVYVGTFKSKNQEDTFFNPRWFQKGQLFINGNNVGRYWPAAGPQITLYVPKSFLQPVNSVIMLELSGVRNCSGTSCAVEFLNYPIFKYDKKFKYKSESVRQFTKIESRRIYKSNETVNGNYTWQQVYWP